MDINICRLCSENNGVTCLFGTVDGEMQLSARVMYCANISVAENDGLPARVCAGCEQQLASTYRFILKCEETDKKLRSWELVVKEEPEMKYDVKLETDEMKYDIDDNFTHDNTFEDYFEPLEKFEVEKSTKRKHVQRSNFNRKSNDDLDPNSVVIQGNISDNHCEPLNNLKEENFVIRVKRKYVKRSNKELDPSSITQDNISDNLLVPLDKLKEENFGIRTKRKYVRKSNVKRKSNKIGPSKCTVCGRMCNNPSTLVIHMRSHTNEKPFACSLCDRKYKDSGSLRRHSERNHSHITRERGFICEHCGKGFFTKVDCKIHMRIHTGETPYQCTKCPSRFTQIGSLQRHMLTHTGEKSHLCSICPKKFATKEELKKHCITHTTEKKYKCPVCHTLFKHHNNLKKHIKMHTSEVKNYICNYCGKAFQFKGNLLLHIKRIHSSKSGYCALCQKHVSNIESHMWKHTGERPLKCEFCSSSFTNVNGLSHHINFRHKFSDKYKCTIHGCTYKFPSQAMLNYHITRYHKFVKPYNCDKCPRSFYRKSDMSRHKKCSHKEKFNLVNNK